MAAEEEPPAVAKARKSCAVAKDELMPVITVKEDYEEVLQACARNVKMGPWTATSGVVLEYYLNASTNFLDKDVATGCTRLTLDLIKHRFRGLVGEGEKLLVIGPDMAGGVMVGQCAALCKITHPDMLDWCDFVYMRKERKKSGTLQQLEGPNHITSRTPDSPVQPAVWLDDANSTGGSLRDGVKEMKASYNVEVRGAVYLVDRAADRATLPAAKLGMADPAVENVEVLALFDLADVDKNIVRA